MYVAGAGVKAPLYAQRIAIGARAFAWTVTYLKTLWHLRVGPRRCDGSVPLQVNIFINLRQTMTGCVQRLQPSDTEGTGEAQVMVLRGWARAYGGASHAVRTQRDELQNLRPYIFSKSNKIENM